MRKLNKTLITSIVILLGSSGQAQSSENYPDILSKIDAGGMQPLNTAEISATRGEYFSSYNAAFRFCATSYPGCFGKIERTRWGKWRVKSRLTKRYLSY